MIKIRLLSLLMACAVNTAGQSPVELRSNFITPPDYSRPGVYWYFMDGNISKKAITDDLESMKKVGIGSVLFLEVNIGVPRGKVDFFSPEWQALFKFIVSECERLEMTLTLGIGPGWTGSGGPWVQPHQSMRHLVSSSVTVAGGSMTTIKLPEPAPHPPYFGAETFTPELRKQWETYYEDQFVLAFPATGQDTLIPLLDRKALVYRDPYTSDARALQLIPESLSLDNSKAADTIAKNDIIDLSHMLEPDGSIRWQVPAGNYTIMRFGMRNNGAITRPAPYAGLGFECDKFDTAACQHHFDYFVSKLIKAGENNRVGGLKTLHMDSWEMGAQNWGDHFRDEFCKRRGYDPLFYLPVLGGKIIESRAISERFLWDLRITAQELVLEHHAGYVKKLAHQHGLNLSIEPYDMNPCSDLDLGAVADEPGCEFWNIGRGFPSAFSCIEAASVANILGKHVVMAEAFTTDWNKDAYSCYPGMLKNQGDWAFCTGVNRFYYHTFAHKAWLGDNLRPGMSMGGYGVNWDRGQTWWELSGEYHKYISRCCYLLRQGRAVADILYVTPQGVPDVFRAPASAVVGQPNTIPDKRGYNFDGCSPRMLMKSFVKNGKIVFESGASYEILVLPVYKTMTPELLNKIESLLAAGASIMGNPPLQSPGLTNYPDCDRQVADLALKIWASHLIPDDETVRTYGKGKIYWGGKYSVAEQNSIYPSYDATAAIIRQSGIPEDFISNGKIRYIHRRTASQDLWFVANKTDEKFTTPITFRTEKKFAEIWDPVIGTFAPASIVVPGDGLASISLQFDSSQSYFIVFANEMSSIVTGIKTGSADARQVVQTLTGPWELSFDPKWGGPENITFSSLDDWSTRPEEGIKYYSGKAIYRKTFQYREKNRVAGAPVYLNLGEVNIMARVKLNGQDLGTVWTAPWQVNMSKALEKGSNQLEIEVVNLWVNRLIGDEFLPYDAAGTEWPAWLLEGAERTSGRYTFTIWTMYKQDAPLKKSGLQGPVTIVR